MDRAISFHNQFQSIITMSYYNNNNCLSNYRRRTNLFLDQHFKNFHACINNEVFKRRYRTKYLLKARAYFCRCMLSSTSEVTSFFFAKLLGLIAQQSPSKKSHNFLANLKKILKHSLNGRIFFFSFRNSMAKC